MTKDQIHQAIDRLNSNQLTQVEAVLERLSTEDPRDRWRGITGLKVPKTWPPVYGDFEAVRLTGEPVSEQLIRDRR